MIVNIFYISLIMIVNSSYISLLMIGNSSYISFPPYLLHSIMTTNESVMIHFSSY